MDETQHKASGLPSYLRSLLRGYGGSKSVSALQGVGDLAENEIRALSRSPHVNASNFSDYSRRMGEHTYIANRLKQRIPGVRTAKWGLGYVEDTPHKLYNNEILKAPRNLQGGDQTNLVRSVPSASPSNLRQQLQSVADEVPIDFSDLRMGRPKMAHVRPKTSGPSQAQQAAHNKVKISENGLWQGPLPQAVPHGMSAKNGRDYFLTRAMASGADIKAGLDTGMSIEDFRSRERYWDRVRGDMDSWLRSIPLKDLTQLAQEGRDSQGVVQGPVPSQDMARNQLFQAAYNGGRVKTQSVRSMVNLIKLSTSAYLQPWYVQPTFGQAFRQNAGGTLGRMAAEALPGAALLGLLGLGLGGFATYQHLTRPSGAGALKMSSAYKTSAGRRINPKLQNLLARTGLVEKAPMSLGKKALIAGGLGVGAVTLPPALIAADALHELYEFGDHLLHDPGYQAALHANELRFGTLKGMSEANPIEFQNQRGYNIFPSDDSSDVRIRLRQIGRTEDTNARLAAGNGWLNHK